MTDRDDILTLISKLHAKAVSAEKIGSQEEAATFAAKVQELLLRHKLSLTEVELAAEEKAEPIKGAVVDPDEFDGLDAVTRGLVWRDQLAAGVAEAHCCVMLLHENKRGEQTYIFVGRDTDRQLAIYVFVTLCRTAKQLSERDYAAAKKNGAPTKGFYRSWRFAFTMTILERYKAEEAALARRLKKTGTSLVRVDKARAQVADFVKEHLTTTAVERKGPTTDNLMALVLGRRAGEGADIRGAALKQRAAGRALPKEAT